MKTRQDAGLLSKFLKSKQENGKIEEVQPHELNDFLSEFIVTVKRKDGGNYEPSSLRGFKASFNRHLKDVKYSKSIVEDGEFEQTRKALDDRCKLLKKEGRGNRPFAAEAISNDEVRVLYESNILGISSAEALINTVWLMNSIHFGLRGCDDYHQMCWSDVKLLRDADGTEYLECSEHQTKKRSGEEPRNIRLVKPKAFAWPDGPPEKDPVFVYKFYSEKRPSSMQTVEVPYYLSINHGKDSSTCWFKASLMGVNKNNGRKSWLRVMTHQP